MDDAAPPPTPPAPPLAPEDLDVAEPGRGRAAVAPWAIPPRGWMDILWRAWGQAGRHRLGSLAGGVTFYLLLATFPAMTAFVSVYGLFLNLDTVGRLMDKLSAVLPDDAVNLIAGEMMRLTAQKHEALGAAFGLGLLASIWSANAGLKALFDALNVAYGETEARPFLRRTLVTYGATLFSLMFLVAVTLLTVAAPVFLHTLGLHRIRVWFTPVRWLIVYVMAAGAFTLLYRHGPSRAVAKWRWVAPGGAGAALVWMVGSIGFSSYLNNFAHFGATYGSLGAVVGFMLWVWFTVMIILAGAELNAEAEHQTAHDTTAGPPAPLGARGAVMADDIGAAFTVSITDAIGGARAVAGRQLATVRRWVGRG